MRNKIKRVKYLRIFKYFVTSTFERPGVMNLHALAVNNIYSVNAFNFERFKLRGIKINIMK